MYRNLLFAFAITLATAANAADCPTFEFVGASKTIDSGGMLRENSGIVSSRLNPQILWGHNDGPDATQIFALTTEGRFLGAYILDEAEERRMEDISCGPGPEKGANYIYLGLIGDNAKKAKQYQILRVKEPAVDPASISADPAQAPKVRLEGVERLTFTYPDGSHDCEALMVDPISGDIFLPVKSGMSEDGPRKGRVYRIPASEFKDGAKVVAEHVATLTNRMNFANNVGFTGADISSDGTRIIVKNLAESFLWFRDPATESVADVLKKSPTAPCTRSYGFDGRKTAPKNEKFIGFDEEAPEFRGFLGEAIGFELDGKGFYCLREGKNVAIQHFKEKQ